MLPQLFFILYWKASNNSSNIFISAQVGIIQNSIKEAIDSILKSMFIQMLELDNKQTHMGQNYTMYFFKFHYVPLFYREYEFIVSM